MGNHTLRPLVAAGAALLAVAALAPVAHGDPPEDRTGTFTALTYNVAGLPEELSGSEPATNSPLISPMLNDYDLVLLQENWADVAADQRQAGLIPEDVPRTGYHDLVVADAHHPHQSEPAPAPPPPNSPTNRGAVEPALTADGLNRLSQLAFGPLTHVEWQACNGTLALTGGEEALKESGLDDVFDDNGFHVVNDEVDGGSADCGAQKGFSVATTELGPGVFVDVYNLHAEAGNGPDDEAAAREGFAQLAEFITTHSAGKAIILGGDTNLHSLREDRQWEIEVWRTFRDATGLHDVCEVVDCGADDGRIDKFAFRSADGLTIIPQTYAFHTEKFTRADGERLSDHDPLAVTFKWVRTGRL